MKTLSKITNVVLVSTILATAMTSCNKEKFTTRESTTVKTSTPEDLSHTKKPSYTAGIRSNEGYPAAFQTNLGDFRIYSSSGMWQMPVVTNGFGNYIAGLVYPTVTAGYAASGMNSVYAYKTSLVGITLNVFGAEYPVLNQAETALFNASVEEIEIDPATGFIYALCKLGGMQVYRLDDMSGYYKAVLLMNGTSPNIFNNVSINGYKSGSICFYPNGDGTNRMVFTNESSVYSSYGLRMWNYNIVGNTVVPISAISTSYNTASTGIPGALTGKINTAYGDGKFYFARDNGNLYTIDITQPSNTVAATVQITTTPLQNKNDFSYYKNF
jgi:hypothetical protein